MGKIPVLTWCCICGVPVALEVEPSYKFALHEFMGLDRLQLTHRDHVENGGWGVHWRLDEVLEAVFPNEHVLPRFIRPPWYEGDAALEFEVKLATADDLRRFAKQTADPGRRMLTRWINEKRRSRSELRAWLVEAGMNQDVWDTNEIRERFEILFFRTPFAIAVDRATGEKGSLMFQEEPRLYFGFDTTRAV